MKKNFSRAVWVREALEAQGWEAKALWASHVGWNSKPADWPGPASIWGGVDAATQAAYTVAALARAEREWPWMGALCLNSFQPRFEDAARAVPDAEEHWGFAIVGPEGIPRPVYETLQGWASRPEVATPGVHPAGTDLATFEGTWTLGPQGADIGQSGDRVRLDFEGTGVALTVRRGPYRAFLFVTVDGAPAPALPRDREGRAYVVLYDPLAAVATVPLAENLPEGVHTVEVVAERGWDQWALVDWRVVSEPETRTYRLGLGLYALLAALGVGIAVFAGRRVDWGGLGDALAAFQSRVAAWLQVVVSLLLSAVYLFAAWQTLGQGVFRRLGEGGGVLTLLLATGLFYFSPWFLLTLAAGALVALIVILRPDLGLALVMLAAPLYMHPLSLLGKSFSLAELILLPTLAGCLLTLATRHASRLTDHASRIPHHVSGSKYQVAGSKYYRSRLTFDVSRFTHHASRAPLLPILAFVLVATLSTAFAAHRHEALRELRLVIVEPVLFYLALVTLPLTRRERWRVVDGFVLGAVVVAVVGLVQYFLLGDVITAEGGIRRLRSIYGSPNNVGLYLGRVLPLLVALALWGGKAGAGQARTWRGISLRRLLYALAALPVGAALLLSLSRGSLVLGIPAAFLAMGLLAGPKWRRATLVVLALGLLALMPLLRLPRFAGLLDWRQGTTGFRLALWHSAWAMIGDHPILGVGPDNFLYAYRTRYVLPTAWEEFNLSHPHNIVMDFAARLVVLGLDGWQESKGVAEEIRIAESHEIPVYLAPTEGNWWERTDPEVQQARWLRWYERPVID